jgi:hypothetical protein
MFVYGLHWLKAKPSVIDDSIKIGILVFFLVFGSLFVINEYYYKTNKPSYYLWNKFIYIYLVWPLIGAQILMTIIDLFTGSVLPSLPAGGASYYYDNMKTADIVNEYYKQQNKKR